ncbi:hypothetical protein GGP41_003524 [Bipolaris sorokiniana]|uniref:Secreted protein n=1 Tax=Cochliobolus sativus TaxID=45130 RepID=A0A8H5ZBH7_COCSA|nr:hypothetical protein GGP41_003524 [Bipolaris sorokiniana]
MLVVVVVVVAVVVVVLVCSRQRATVRTRRLSPQASARQVNGGPYRSSPGLNKAAGVAEAGPGASWAWPCIRTYTTIVAHSPNSHPHPHWRRLALTLTLALVVCPHKCRQCTPPGLSLPPSERHPWAPKYLRPSLPHLESPTEPVFCLSTKLISTLSTLSIPSHHLPAPLQPHGPSLLPPALLRRPLLPCFRPSQLLAPREMPLSAHDLRLDKA